MAAPIVFFLGGVKCLSLCFPGENGESELLSGQSAVRQPGPVYISSGGSGGSRGGSLHSGSHCAHHSPHIQVNSTSFQLTYLIVHNRLHCAVLHWLPTFFLYWINWVSSIGATLLTGIWFSVKPAIFSYLSSSSLNMVLLYFFTWMLSGHHCSLSGGKANRPWGTTRRCRSSWRTWRPVWEIAVRRSSQV